MLPQSAARRGIQALVLRDPGAQGYGSPAVGRGDDRPGRRAFPELVLTVGQILG